MCFKEGNMVRLRLETSLGVYTESMPVDLEKC